MEREISIILKVRGAKQAKKAVQDVFDGQTGKLVKDFNKNLDKTDKGFKKVNRSTKNTSKSMMGFTKVLGRGMAALYLYNRAWNVFGTQFEEGMQLERASDQFSRNVGNVTKMLPELRSATKGIISDFDLLKTANRAFQQGIKPESMGRTFKLATVAAQRLGLQASEAINTITNAITKQDEGALNTLGIVTKVNQAYKTQAALIAKNGGVMSNAMSIQLRQSLIMKELEKRFGGVNNVQQDGLSILERFRASWKNFRAEIGQTLGIALRPLIQALTGVLDVTTKVLSKLNDTGGFQKFVQIAMTFAGVIGAVKFINGARTLMSLFGFLGGKGGGLTKAPRALSATTNLIAKFSKYITSAVPMIGRFVGFLSKIAPSLSRAFALVPGWGVAIAGVMLLFKPLKALISGAYTSAKVFFQLLNNFDADSGLSKVLKEDADALGGFYYTIETVAKATLWLGSVAKGVFQAIGEVLAPVGQAWDWLGETVTSVANKFGLMTQTGTLSGNGLDRLTNKVKNLTKWLGFAASAVLTLVNPIAGLAGMGLFGGSLLADSGLSMPDLSMPAISPSIGFSQSFNQPQQSTEMNQPTPRAQNLEYTEDQSEILKKMNKILEKQTDIMEVDSQKQDIRDSRNDATGNLVLRR